MKKKLFIAACLGLVVLFTASCKTGVFTAQSGRDDVAYLQFVSSTSLSGAKVLVELDRGTSFEAKVTKERKSYKKPHLYTIKPGKRSVKVIYRGRIIYNQKIFVSQQATKVIRL